MIFWIWGNILLIAEFGNKTIHHQLVSSGWMVIIRDQVVLFLLSMGILIKLWSQFYIVSQAVKETCNFCSFPRGAHLMKSGYFEPFNCTIITVLSLLSSVKCSTSWGYGCRRNQMDMDCILIARVCKKHIFKTVFWNTHYITARCKEQQIVKTGCVSPKLLQNIIFAPCKYFLLVRWLIVCPVSYRGSPLWCCVLDLSVSVFGKWVMSVSCKHHRHTFTNSQHCLNM